MDMIELAETNPRQYSILVMKNTRNMITEDRYTVFKMFMLTVPLFVLLAL